MPRISAYITELSPGATPNLVIDSGALVSATMPPFSPPATRGKLGRVVGPIAVNGAAPGDVLVVEMRRFRPAGGYLDGQPVTVTDGLLRLPGDVQVAIRPSVGFIATAPADGPSSCLAAGEYGGNLDCRRIRPGARIYLPVNIPGGLLTVGNFQLLRGDGQSEDDGIPAGGSAEFTVALVKGFAQPAPLIVEGGSVMTVATAATVEEASRSALDKLARLVAKAFDVGATEAATVARLCGQVRICRLEERLAVVRVEFSHALLAERGMVF